MTRVSALAAMLIFSLRPGCGQDAAKSPSFEVASVRLCEPGTPDNPGEHSGMVQFTSPGGRFRATAITMKFLLEWAYQIQPSQHSAGPSWMSTDHYDVIAKAEGNATDDQMRLMLRKLLADQFHLKFHRENRQLSVFVVSLGQTAPKLFPPKEDEVHNIQVLPQKDTEQKTVSWHVVATRFSLAQLTDTFARQLGRVIVNRTGMDGEYDFTLDLTPDENSPNPLDPTLIMDAMRKQLGLTLKTQETQVDYLIIDTAERVVAGN